MPLIAAATISLRPSPKVMAPAAGRRASRIATSASASAPASVSMCAASESSASELARMPTTTSTHMKPAIRTSAIASRRESASCVCP